MTLGKYFPYTFIIVIVLLFFYSFTQVDLGLTISKYPTLHLIENGFKQVGYFNRQLSTFFYLGIISLMFVYFAYFLNLSFLKEFIRNLNNLY